jgi:hypothetical protein
MCHEEDLGSRILDLGSWKEREPLSEMSPSVRSMQLVVVCCWNRFWPLLVGKKRMDLGSNLAPNKGYESPCCIISNNLNA